MLLDAAAPSVRALIDCLDPVTLLEHAAAARERGDEWGLLITTSDELGALSGCIPELEKDCGVFTAASGVYLGVHAASTLRRAVTRRELGESDSREQLDATPPLGHVRLVGVTRDQVQVSFLRADREFVEHFIGLEQRVAQLAEEALPALEALNGEIPPPPYGDPLVVVVLRTDDPALVRLRLLRRGAFASVEQPSLIGSSSGLYAGVHAGEEVVEALGLRTLENPAVSNACAFLLQDGTCVRSIVKVEDHFLLGDL
jgi:hypothetical protein